MRTRTLEDVMALRRQIRRRAQRGRALASLHRAVAATAATHRRLGKAASAAAVALAVFTAALDAHTDTTGSERP
jgi:hypothetical protein